MAVYQIAWNPTTKAAKIQADGAAPGGGFTDIGSFNHFGNDAADEIGDLGTKPFHESHVFYQHVQDLLYKQGVLSLQGVTIEWIPVTAIASTIGDNTLTVGQTSPITTVFTPLAPSHLGLIYTSDKPSVATVSDTGVVTGVKAGAANIEVRSRDGGFMSVVPLTVS